MTDAYRRAMGLGDVEIMGDPAAVDQGSGEPVKYRDTGAEYNTSWVIDFGFGFSTATGLPTVIPNLGRATFHIEPRTPFRPHELTIGSDITPGLFITNIEHADRKYIDGDPVPAAQFSEVSTRKELRLPTVNPSDVCVIEVQNLSGAAVSFSAALRGVKVSR
jgi:hypothetical protein